MKSRYQWQGEPVKVHFGYVHQEENEEKPMYWYNFECYMSEEPDGSYKDNHFVLSNGKKFSLIPAIHVIHENGSFLLANHCGVGVHKLLNGGWPNYRHYSLDGNFYQCDRPEYKFTKFNLEEFEKYESNRMAWQKKTYPEEFAKMEALRASLKNNQKRSL